MKITAEPRSDQINADDFLGSPHTYTIAGVRPGSAEQKYDVLLEGEDRVWRPPLTMLRLLMAAWGDEADVWTGRHVTLYRDASVKFGPDDVGGIRVSHMSHLPGGKPFSAKVTVKRGRRAPITVQPLADAPAPSNEPTAEQVAACTDENELRDMWGKASAGTRKLIEDRVSELRATADAPPTEAEEGPSE